MHIDLWTLALQTVNALVLIWLLAHFLFRPVAAAVAARRAAAERLLEEAAAARSAAQSQAAELASARVGLAGEGEKLLAAAHEQAVAESESLLAEARETAGRLRAEAQAAIARDREAAQVELQRQAEQLAVWSAGRLLAGLPQDALTAGFLAALRAELDRLPESERAMLLSDDGALELVSATPLDAPGQAALPAMLGGVRPRLAVDPALLAGLELRGAHVTIRMSLQAALERVGGALARQGPNNAAAA